MKKGDIIGPIYFIILVVLLIVFIKPFIYLTQHYPIPMGFLKVSLLGTFGECLKTRIKTGTWKINHPVQRFILWGLFGIWFAWVFPLFRGGVTTALIAKNLWFGGPNVVQAFSKSLWINVLGGYAYFMMLSHEYLNNMIEKQGFIGAQEFKDKLNTRVWFPCLSWSSIPVTILWFWLPAHTITFSLPGHFQVLCAAMLSIALGFILTIKK